MDRFYEEMYEYLISEGIEDEEATEVVNYLFEDNIHEYGLITENKGRAFLNMLKAVGYMSGVLKPKAKQAVKTTVNKITSGNLRQGKLLTKTGKAQDFTKGKMPFTGTDPVPAASSPLPQPKVPAAQSPGQLKLKLYPPAKPKAVSDLLPTKVQSSAPKPEFGPNAVKSTPYKTSKPELRPGGRTPEPEFKVTQPRTNAGGATVIPRTNANTRVIQPPAPKPEFGPNAVKPVKPVKPTKANKVIAAVKKSALPVGVAGATGLALSGGKGPKKSEDPRRPDGSLPPYTPPRPVADPKPEVKPEPSKEEKPTRPAKELSAAAKDFDRAFAAARKEGKKEFTWRGKQYNTKYKGG